MDAYNKLIGRLDRFTRKYYLNKVIRGFLYTTALVVPLFLLVTALENHYYFDPSTRKILFFSFIGISILAAGYWIAFPFSKYLKLGALISHERAAEIIGTHFGEVKDKLLNILQLKAQADSNVNSELILAGISQKTSELNPVSFPAAIDLRNNRKYLKYALPPVLLLIFLLFSSNIIERGTNRLVNNNTVFERPAPFKFDLLNKSLDVIQYEDIDLIMKSEGDVLPDEAFIHIDDYSYKLNRGTEQEFKYTLSKLQGDVEFYYTSGDVRSKKYTINVLKKPAINGFLTNLNYPNYTGRTDESLSNIGDLVVPAGTYVSWDFDARNTAQLDVRINNNRKLISAKTNNKSNYKFGKKYLRDGSYTVYVSNQALPLSDSVKYSVSVIPDQYPTISVREFTDTTDAQNIYFVGSAGDDYGFSTLNFNYTISSSNSASGISKQINIPFVSSTQIDYDYQLDIKALDIKPGSNLSYYFEVFDNDGVNGAKSAKTSVMTYKVPSLEEIEEKEDENNEAIKDDLEKSIEDAAELKKEMKELQEKLLQKDDIDWKDKKEIEKLLEKQKNLENQINQAKKNFEENLKNQEKFQQVDEQLLQKQEQLKKMFDELLSDEMKEMFQKMEEMLEKMDKEMTMEDLEEAELSEEELEKELDRMLEMFKQLEVENEMLEAIDELEKLGEEQEKLAEETEKENKSSEELKKEQEKIEEKFDKISEKFDDIEKKNEELEEPMDLDTPEESEEEEIEEDMKDSKSGLQKGQKKKASKSQKNAGKKMKDMAQKMSESMQQSSMEQMEKDIESLRQLLENLVTLSFEEETNLKEVKIAQVNTPNYVKLVQNQYKIKDDFKLVEDSLHALSKRVFQIESYVTEKVTDIKKNLATGLDNLEERKKPQALVNQQFTMKGLNDLALMLSETMQQMQQQMAGQMEGNQQCQKPGNNPGGKKAGKSMGDMQKKLNEQLRKMQQGLKDGKVPGRGMSKEFAESAAKQAAMRKALEDLQKEQQGQGKGASKELQKLIDEMDKAETDLVNKKLTNEMLNRQKEILSRLLDHEKAMRERQYEEKRESKSAQEIERKIPPGLEEYLKKRKSEIDAYKTVSPSLKPYYKYLVEQYFKSLKAQ